MRRSVATSGVALVVVGCALLAACDSLGSKPAGADRPLTAVAAPQPTADFSDDFGGATLKSQRWNTCHWWNDEGCTIASNEELEWYLPSQVSVHGGVLRLTADHRPVTGSDGKKYPYRSGMVTTGPATYGARAKYAFTYGRVEARVRVPSGRGLWPALWLLPATQVSRPEIDVLEAKGHRTDVIDMHLHPKDRSRRSHAGRANIDTDLSRRWHTIGLDWQPGELRWYVDGAEVWRVLGGDVPREPMYLVMNLAVGGVYPGPPTRDTKFPASFEIDFVRVWRSAS